MIRVQILILHTIRVIEFNGNTVMATRQACCIASDLGSPVTAAYRVATTAKNTAVQLSAISHP